MKYSLNQTLDYSKILGNIICKTITIEKKFTSEFLRNHSDKLINFKNTKKVLPGKSNTNLILFNYSESKSNKKMKKSKNWCKK